ncbi:HutD family protein [Clostridium felsineum]|uniref:Protein Ves n=1 Tax=Clostridium felsineum TaxID=36839 RepID=A0A1S8M8F9_9CLOT|nr:HutD family protein [Clostridium felsineum]URZ08243.1 Protein Ves [Clostridium felsineum]URZ13274.1 Protein Ves [Clostridium felsineum]
MNVEIIKKGNYNVSEWSGGKTTELYIYPTTSKYNDRNFMWRISAATVDAPESNFTSLPGFARKLMVTEGETILEHSGKYKIVLKPFDKDSFMGDFETKSYGKASDFNLMTSSACSGDINLISVEPFSKIKVENKSLGKVMESFYFLNGEAEVKFQDKEFKLDEKDLFYINYEKNDAKIEVFIINRSNEEVKVIRTIVLMS